MIYLPVLGGGGEGNGHAGGSPGEASKASSPAPSRASKGRAYPGPQPILSDPVNPTNDRQTIIQPAREQEKPKILQQFVPLPNMVKIAKPKLPLPTDLVSGKPELPEFQAFGAGSGGSAETGVAGHATAGADSSRGGKTAAQVRR